MNFSTTTHTCMESISLATSLEGIIHRDKEHCRTILTDYTDLTQILFPILNYNFICDIT